MKTCSYYHVAISVLTIALAYGSTRSVVAESTRSKFTLKPVEKSNTADSYTRLLNDFPHIPVTALSGNMLTKRDQVPPSIEELNEMPSMPTSNEKPADAVPTQIPRFIVYSSNTCVVSICCADAYGGCAICFSNTSTISIGYVESHATVVQQCL
ncbi:hypothetical protein THASP1DRAFT_24200 [Thamnocephalis sphaerospora]|uniref:Uncharacterized protein n=1 Tax=Thamnocephalis sphaerospora TaxID=78915 RepID=A0A4P9XP07_9FUNG|nr:hypothetical protein THASP1DRAFT_24200 [Thamnocephalis sphaerospora]|eukprot:RKP07698.1 hypothetical protein THASP1DRAFT_24200 [Thamnocephalis sphaerospora]